MKKFEWFGVSAIALLAATPAYAETAPAPQEVQQTSGSFGTDQSDDIVVTATKREQTLQDVPISVSVTGADTIAKAQIRDLIDLQSVVPSLKVAQLNAVGQTNFVIRGFGNGNGNDGIESSVGVFIDGVYRSRSAAGLDDLPEIERVEVLRGPQSTLFGKNVSVGAISIITKRPDFSWHTSTELTYGNYNQMIARASITGPISDTLAFRVSGNINERDGYFHNLNTGQDINNRNRWSVRGDLLWQPSADLSVRILADYNLIKERCCGVTGVLNGPATLVIGALGFGIGNTNDLFSRNVYSNVDPDNRVRGEGVSGQIDYNLGFARVTSITAYRNQQNASNQDIDFTGANLATNQTSNNIKTFTQEVRLASASEGPLSWLIGGFYEDERLDTGRTIRYQKDIRPYINLLTGNAVTQLETLQSLVNPTIIPGRTYFQPGQGLIDDYHLSQQSYSIFGQADYKITNRLTITGGLAYLNDRKATQTFVTLQDPFSALNLQNVPELGFLPLSILNPAAPPGTFIPTNLFGGLGAVQLFYGNAPNHGPVNYPNANETGIVTGDKVTYAARAAYDFGFLNTYVSYSTGWKASAVNLSSDSRPPDANGVGRGAGPESVKVIEIGAKAKFRGGYFNVALFKETIDGFQSNAFTGLGYALVNAGRESVKGFEIDSAYKPVNWLALTGSVTYLDPIYDSFTGAPCQDYDTVRCPRDPTTGLLPNFRDLTGDKPAGIPEWSVSTSATFTKALTDSIVASLRAEFDWTSDTWLTDSTPPSISTYGQTVVNASLNFSFAKSQLDVTFWGRNLNDDQFLISTFASVAQTGSYSGYPNQPRTYGVTLRKQF